ncbi:C69 family dipeptidase [Azotobacter beijerinckii]|uniref:C69 family dipeptidase n=1 Tax=Azotobacter beijerinckii TaxID=170623 RepID=UPI0029559724|nr:C69 family dipeptidase [Azotobacter beijerinckii]MDV7213686.1 C69 family dipeptidase [Azotobacter beijerinckii]
MCINIAIGREATAENRILVSRNEDCGRTPWSRYVAYRSEPEYASGRVVRDGMWTLGNGLRVAVPRNRFAYSAMPDAAAPGETPRHLHEGRGINENNVAVSTTGTLQVNALANAIDPLLAEGGIDGSVIPTLILPQALTARHGVELLGTYLQKHGASEARGVIVADPFEAWYLENGSAHHWIAVRIPADSYLVVASGLRIHGIDLYGPDVLHSAGLFEFVAEYRLLERPDRRRFDFAQAFGVPETSHGLDRIWLAQKYLTPSLQQGPRQPQYPLFLKPDGELCVTDVMAVLRAACQWMELEGRTPRPGAPRRTAESHIICLNAKMPTELQGLIWQAIGTPLGAPYLPLYHALQEIPHELGMNAPSQEGNSAYRAFGELFSLAGSAGPGALAALQAVWQEQERELVFQQRHLESMLLSMYHQSPQNAVAFAQHYSTGSILQLVEKAHRERHRLLNGRPGRTDDA